MDCHLLSHGISVEKKSLHDCCLTRGSDYSGHPFIINLDEDNNVNWNQVFSLKQKLKNLKIKNKKDCLGCRALSENLNFENDEDYISHINLNHWNICNSRCIYCSKDFFGGDKYFNVYPLMKSLVEENKLKNYGEITFQGGEPTVLPEFEELLNLFLEQKIHIRIHSSGIKYSQAIEDGLKRGLVSIIISPDSAVKKTYEKIKRVKCFDKVWENIKNYSEKGKNPDNVKAKFIIIPGINDSIKEIDMFIKKSLECNLTNIIWEVEGRYAGMYNYDIPNVCFLIDYALHQAKQKGLKDEFYDGAIYAMQKRKTNACKITNKKIFSKQYKELKKQYENRNLNYNDFL